MKTIGEVFGSPRFSAHLAEGRRLLAWQRAADAALGELGEAVECKVAGAEGGRLELQTGDAGAAARLRQVMPSFLAAFNRAAGTEMRGGRVRVVPGN